MPPKRHHYLPRFFLERFCLEGVVWVFDREEKSFRCQQPVNTAVIKDYYAYTTELGEKNLDVEALLSKIESGAAPVLEKIDQGGELTPDDREHLALFVGFLGARVPDFEKTFTELVDHTVKVVARQTFDTVDRTNTLMDAFDMAHPDAKPIDRESLHEFIQSGEYNVEPHRNYVLAVMLQVAIEQATLFSQMDWVIIRSPGKKTFVISDSPLSVVAPLKKPEDWMGVGIITPGAKKLVPLGVQTCLVMGDAGGAFGYVEATDGMVREANLVATARCDRFVFARDERQLRSLVSATRIDATKRGAKIAFS